MNPAIIYDRPSEGRFFSPFNLNLDPMERLLLINFGGDPDMLYTAFEPQVFDDPVNGHGLMVIAYLRDGRLDIYHQPGLTLEHKDFGIVGKGLADMIERPLAGAHFDISPTGVDLAFSFEDKIGRKIAVKIKENTVKPVQPFAILAPLGNATEKPPALPLILLYDFYFIRKSGTELDIHIDGRQHTPDSIPMILDGSRVHFLRYATDPFPVTWNAAYDGPLKPIPYDGTGAVEDNGVTYDLADNDGHPEIHRMRIANDKHELAIIFDPPVPDVACLKAGAQLAGIFAITCEDSSGTVGGVYNVECAGQQVKLTIHPSAGWQPNERKWAVRFIFLLAPLFTQWPKSYVWSATIDLNDPVQPAMQSTWKRQPQANKGLRLFK